MKIISRTKECIRKAWNKVPNRRARKLLVAALIAGGTVTATNAAVLVHDFYLPLPEGEIRQSFLELTSSVGTKIDSVFSVVITGDGTEIYFDHWEDGYEIDLSNPAQSTTEIWGDGINGNGIAPGFVSDPAGLTAGTVLSLRNFVDLPRNPSQTRFDGKDRMAATKALVVSRAGWATSPGPVLSGAVEVTATIDHGTSYVSPVGEDLTSRYFQYVGISVMATEDNTSVSIDPDGSGPEPVDNKLLGRGDTYLINGGIMTGATVDSSKPVQVQLIIGLKTSRYASDWFTLIPFDDWSSSYYTPVGTAADGNATVNYFYNPGGSDLTINYITLSGSGSFVVPAGGVTDFQMPQNSGARFVSDGGDPFFALAKVGARPGGEASYDWGFTLLPADGLTSQAIVGWGPGSSDDSVNGSPVWLTAVADTIVYVDYNGDHLYNGSGTVLVDENGDEYDRAITIQALQSELIFDPDGDQTAMRLYTIDGTLITAAWGEDPQEARPGNPYFDFGTTVLPFPTPVIRKTGALTTDNFPVGLSVSDTITYTIELDNRGLLPLGNTVVIDDLPIDMVNYVTNSTTYDGNPLPDATSGTPFPLDDGGFTIPVILRDGSSQFSFDVLVTDVGSITNEVRAAGYSLAAAAVVSAPPSGGATQSVLDFTDAGGVSRSFYQAGEQIFVKLDDYDNSAPTSIETIDITVRNETTGDLETITLTETGIDTGIFTNGLPSDATSGLLEQDGTLFVAPGDQLSVTYTDAYFGDFSSTTAIIQVPSLNKVLYLANGNTMDRIDPEVSGGATQNSALSGPVSSVITNGPTTSQTYGNFSSSSFSYNSGTSQNRLLLVGVAYQDDNSTAPVASVQSITYAGVNLSRVRRVATGFEAGVELWMSTNEPPTGANTMVLNMNTTSDLEDVIISATTFSGVDLSNPLSQIASQLGEGFPGGVTVTPVGDEIAFAVAATDNATTSVTGPNNLWYEDSGSSSDGISSAGAFKNDGTGNFSWSWAGANGDDHWGAIAVAIKPAPGSSGDTISFTQNPVFATDFTMPSNTVISITNFVNVTSGSMPAAPSVSAALFYDTNVIFSAGSASYNGGAGTLVWSAAITNEIAIPTGEELTFWVQNNESGVDFEIQHDSSSAPSKVLLPTTTVIDINSMAVYDEPYPDGSLVTAISAGSRLYIRAAVSDPFGAYDITGLDLVVDGPGSSDDFSTSLTDSDVVATNTSSKTYEYVWETGPNVGAFNISATAHEGSEGITDTAASSISLVFLDLGTPAGIEFTDSNNGTVTNNFVEDSDIFIRVSDSDQNYQTNVAEQIVVAITSGSDSNVVTLTETAGNSGLFTGSIMGSSTGGIGSTNILNAPGGSIITASYIDSDDSGDMASVTGTILPSGGSSGPSLTVNKTLVSPANGQAALSNIVSYAIQVVNTGTTTLSGVGLEDDFPGAFLSFVSASHAPDATNANQLVWNDIGTLNSGDSVEITVDFMAIALGDNITNSASASDGATTGGGNVPISITESLLTVDVSLVDPAGGTALIGTSAIFEVAITNAGSTSISTLPIEHLFSSAQYSYDSMVTGPAPEGIGAGLLLWTNAASTALLPGQSLLYQVRMNVIGAGSPAEYRTLIEYAIDEFGRAVPVVEDTAGLISSASSIGGYVYTDFEPDGMLGTNDTGLGNVSIQLYSDPDGNGDPSDGSVIRISTSGPDGYYDLPNLGTGDFVIVQTDLPGYASSSPNTIPVTISTVENIITNFFDYIPSAVSYASIGGTVWLDTDGSGALEAGETNGLASVALSLIQDVDGNGLAGGGEPVTASINTDAFGGYTFFSVVTGNYVVVKTDLFGHSNTWDSVGLNDNQIGLAVTNGQNSVGNDFLAYFTGNTPGNDAPVTAADSYAVDEDNLLSVIAPGILGNDNDVDGDPLSAVLNATTTNGVLILSTNGGFNYTPATNYFGSDSFSYAVTDGSLTGSTVVVSITINSINDVPTAVDDSATTGEDNPVLINVLGNDSDDDGDSLTLTGASSTNGLASISGTNVVFTPATNFFGTAFVSYYVTDGPTTSTGTVTITVNSINDIPVINDDSATTNEDTPIQISVLGNDFDGDGDALTLIGTSSTNGLATISGTNVVYTPATNYFGSSVFTYSVFDGSATNSGQVTVTINAVNDAPIINDDVASTDEDTTVQIGVLGNDSDADGDSLTLLSVSSTNGISSISGTNVVYTPPTNYVGSSVLTYFVFDGTVTNSGQITVAVNAVNDAPNAMNDSATTDEDTSVLISVLANDSDDDGDSLTLTGVSSSNGLASISGTNVLYNPATNYFGTNVLFYYVSDSSVSSTGQVTIIVNPINDAPTVVDDNSTTPEDGSVQVSVLTNDSDDDGDSLTLTGASSSNGLVSVVGTNVVYTPATNYFGTNMVFYYVTDGSASSTGQVTIIVTSVNDAPTALDDSVLTPEDTLVQISVLSNDSDVDGDSLTLTGVTATNGLASVSGTNVVYTPPTNFVGATVLDYFITDGSLSSTGQVTITVSSSNDVPNAVDDSATTTEDTPVQISVLSNDSDDDGDSLTLTGASTSNGLASVSGTNVVYTPATNYFGTNVVYYYVTDGVATSTGQVTVVVNSVNDAPAAIDDSVSTNEDSPVTISVLSNDSDAEGDTISLLGVTGSNGVASVSGTNVVYNPSTNYFGTNVLFYYVTDGSANSTGSVTVIVNSVNDAPIVVDDSASTTEDTQVMISVLGNDSDDDGDMLTLTGASGSNGMASVSGTNVVFTPTTGFLGSTVINYFVTDGSVTSTGMVTLTVGPSADVSMILSGQTNGVVGLPMSFILTITNAGPSVASNIVVRNSLPTNEVFEISAVNGAITNNTISWPVIDSLAPGGTSNVIVTITAQNPVVFTNLASAISTTFDPDPSNNDSSSGSSRLAIQIFAADYAAIDGPITLNTQNGLFEQQVTVSNTMVVAAPAFRLFVDGLRPGVTLNNATAEMNGVPYVQVNTPVNPGESVDVYLEYYVPDRQSFTNALSVVWVVSEDAAIVAGAGTAITDWFMDTQNPSASRFVIEFTTVPGEAYTVLYKDSLSDPWRAAVPPVVAGSTRTQWYDDGPPKTRSHPSDTTNRFYSVIISD